ncbi:hypothetical protein QBC36DRAFT_329608 [Triangularia setosa]|uniref:Uncharacterized protein n=1 Tax=Triangularia setosa TaxID=2587417 RepID=A0AAN6W755_9PEZI|nr:hypothetical protein QBC36DRAFT_329608 [Podospora setosa]
MVRPEIEILVHIAAPARATDDKRYRTLAAAYLDFEPVVCTEILSRPPRHSVGDTQPSEREFVEYGFDQPPQSSQAFGGIESPILSFRSAEHNFNSPGLQPVVEPEHGISEMQISWQAPPSEVPDSMPDNNVLYDEICTPSRRLDFFTSSLDSQHLDSSPLAQRRSQRLAGNSQSGSQLRSQLRRSPRRRNFQEVARAPEPSLIQSSLPQPGPAHPSISHSTPPCGQPHGQASSRSWARLSGSLYQELPRLPPSDAANKVIPQSPDIYARKGLSTQPSQPSTGELIEETTLYSSNPSQKLVPCSQEPPVLARADSEPVAKRRRIAADPEPSQPLTRCTSDIGPRRQPPVEIISNKPTAYYKSKLTIYAPSPPTAQTELGPEDVISPVLAKLATELDLPTRFNPQSQTRGLRPFERGYWLVDTISWPPDLKKSAWIFLTDYIEKGIAGWGTSCSRDRDYSWIKLWCWGCVVGHMHLLLYVASRRQVKNTGMKWFGGDGGAVVVMGPR